MGSDFETSSKPPEYPVRKFMMQEWRPCAASMEWTSYGRRIGMLAGFPDSRFEIP